MAWRVLLLVVVVVAGCTSPTTPETVGFSRLSAGASSYSTSTGITERERTVICDAGTWAAFWTRMHAKSGAEPPRPAIDFSTEMIVAVAMGARATGGFHITMPSAKVEAGVLVVEVVSQSPGASCFTTQATTQPVDLARARPFADVRFEERDVVFNCG